MTKAKGILTLLIGAIIVGCNPECENIFNVRVDALVKQQGQQMLIMADNLPALQESEIQFISSGETKVAKHIGMTDKGLIVEVPEDIEGDNIQLFISDPDCGLAVLGSAVTVGNADFFVDNPNFIPPAPFEFVIPTPPIQFPPLVQNAWISPQNLDYCIWFKFHPETDNNGNIVYETINGMVVPKESVNLNSSQSFEFSVQELVCDGNGAGQDGICPGEVNSFYHCNPVSGIIDKQNNYVSIRVDRTDINGQNFGIEEFEGEFINIQEAGYNEQKVPSCSSSIFDPTKNYLILLTSKSTGRQLLLYQQGFL